MRKVRKSCLDGWMDVWSGGRVCGWVWWIMRIPCTYLTGMYCLFHSSCMPVLGSISSTHSPARRSTHNGAVLGHIGECCKVIDLSHGYPRTSHSSIIDRHHSFIDWTQFVNMSDG
mmetsp:Transcript_38103/g.108802  ORF Transcript_38103/g.108802 Transcript_38103/m.108802 type:complete len:115 (-) Transcript_38103:452-796(-)